MGQSAFSDCYNLLSFNIPNTISTIKDGTFCGCSSLKSIYIPDSVVEIGGAFGGCSSLTNIDIPDSVIKIGNAFNQCSSLATINIPSSVTEIGEGIFYGCTSLVSVNIGNNITFIPACAFDECPSLKTISIGKAVEKIDCYFRDSPSLRQIYCQSTIPAKLKYGNDYYFITFGQNTYDNAVLYVPAGCKKKYEEADGWKKFRKIDEMDAGVEETVGEDMAVRVVNGSIVIDGVEDSCTIEVYDMTGKIVYNGAAADIPNMPRGIYVIRIGGKTVKVAV